MRVRAISGTLTEKSTPRPSSSTRQPMTSRLPGQRCSPDAPSVGPSPFGRQKGRGGPVGEERAGDEIGLAAVAEPEDHRAELDDEHQDELSGGGPGQGGAASETLDTAAAAEAEDRRALDILAQAQALGDEGIQARRRDAGRGHADDLVDLVEPATGPLDASLGRLGEKARRVLEIEPVLLGRPTAGELRLERQAHMAPVDAGIVEQAEQPVGVDEVGGEQPPRGKLRIALGEAVRGNRRRQGKKTGHLHLQETSNPSTARSRKAVQNPVSEDARNAPRAPSTCRPIWWAGACGWDAVGGSPRAPVASTGRS